MSTSTFYRIPRGTDPQRSSSLAASVLCAVSQQDPESESYRVKQHAAQVLGTNAVECGRLHLVCLQGWSHPKLNRRARVNNQLLRWTLTPQATLEGKKQKKRRSAKYEVGCRDAFDSCLCPRRCCCCGSGDVGAMVPGFCRTQGWKLARKITEVKGRCVQNRFQIAGQLCHGCGVAN